MLYQYGRGVKQDYAEARRLYEPACAAGIANACDYLGDFYQQGRGVKPDPAAARRWYAKACQAGSKSHCAKAGSAPARKSP